ncbi:hypothetical protein VPHD69_0145 [Vibrio phage D69]
MYKNLKAELLTARKAQAKDRAALITGVVDDIDKKVMVARKAAEAKGEEFIVPDAEVVATLKNIAKNMRKASADIVKKVGECEASEDYLTQANVVDSFLPEKVVDDELRLLIQGLGASNMGQAMSMLKKQSLSEGFDYDGAEASKIARELFV